MPGFSITLLLLPQKHESDAPSAELILSLLDEQPEVPAWKWASRAIPVPQVELFTDHRVEPGKNLLKGIKVADPNTFVGRLRRAAMALIKAEQEITKMDSIAGDGDCGLTLKVGFLISCLHQLIEILHRLERSVRF
jgi:dihydroxyacetone kinase